MSQQFSTTKNAWGEFLPFYHEGVKITVTPYAGSDHSAATTVFTSKSDSEVFHADKHCHRLHVSEPYLIDGEKLRSIYAETLEAVLTSWLNPIRPCNYCTQDINTSAEIVQNVDGVPEDVLRYYEPGDVRVNEQWSRGDDGYWKLASRTETEVCK